MPGVILETKFYQQAKCIGTADASCMIRHCLTNMTHDTPLSNKNSGETSHCIHDQYTSERNLLDMVQATETTLKTAEIVTVLRQKEGKAYMPCYILQVQFNTYLGGLLAIKSCRRVKDGLTKDKRAASASSNGTDPLMALLEISKIKI